MTRTSTFFSERYRRDHLNLGDRCRQDAAVVRATTSDGIPVWVITRHDDARNALTDPRLIKDGATVRAAISRQLPEAGDDDPGRNAMFWTQALFADPPNHTRLRGLLQAAFTTRRVNALKPGFQEMTDDLIRGLPSKEPFDLMTHFAIPLPLAVICELLGVPTGERGELRRWTDALNENDPAVASKATRELDEFFGGLIERKRRVPGDDLVSDLIHGVPDGADRLSHKELVGTSILLLNAGHDTTANLIGNTVRWLLADREARWIQLAHLHPEKIPAAIEEILRFDGPVQMATQRVSREDVEYGGVTIPAGEIVLISLLTANRDPDRFIDADRICLGREDNQHLSFGRGIHRCIGATLGRMEAQVSVSALARRFPEAELAEQNRWERRESTVMNGLKELIVQLNA
ncbi:MAG TPA: cytochrome P450 [Pseudonocardiaceae bacterium]|jgi:cytochrome P450